MKKIIAVSLLVATQVCAAGPSNKSERMNDLLIESGIISWGRTSWRNGHFGCRLDKQTLSIYSCKLKSGNKEGYYALYRIFSAEESANVVDLLHEFGVETWGKRKSISIDIECQYPKRSNLIECGEVEHPSFML